MRVGELPPGEGRKIGPVGAVWKILKEKFQTKEKIW